MDRSKIIADYGQASEQLMLLSKFGIELIGYVESLKKQTAEINSSWDGDDFRAYNDGIMESGSKLIGYGDFLVAFSSKMGILLEEKRDEELENARKAIEATESLVG